MYSSVYESNTKRKKKRKRHGEIWRGRERDERMNDTRLVTRLADRTESHREAARWNRLHSINRKIYVYVHVYKYIDIYIFDYSFAAHTFEVKFPAWYMTAQNDVKFPPFLSACCAVWKLFKSLHYIIDLLVRIQFHSRRLHGEIKKNRHMRDIVTINNL